MATRLDGEALVPPGGLVPGVDALGAYHLLRALGSGGMASVWLAVDARTGREVAVKRMLPALLVDHEHHRSFAAEAKLNLALKHRNIIEAIELDEVMGAHGVEPYLVLELLKGRSLMDVLRAASRAKLRVPLGVVIRVVADAARGLHHAHAAVGPDGRPLGVVHRDVSPHNLFVCGSGVVKVLDFGIAKVTASDQRTRTGFIKGKFSYVSPEQIRGQRPDARVDVFALGIVLYECLVGRPLFRGENEAETLHRVLMHDIRPPETIRADVPAALGAVALRALQRDRDRRLPSAAALADAIEAVAEASSIAATTAEVRAFFGTLFPHDAEEHAEDAALARRTYERLSSGSYRTLGSNPWMTPAHGVTMAVRRPRLARSMSSVLGALALMTAAALATALVARHPPRPHLLAPATPITPVTRRPVTPATSHIPRALATPHRSRH